jgi:SAM-dependent methyltransferase
MTTGDAWGTALLDHLEGRDGPTLMLEVENGTGHPALAPAWFFRSYDEWEAWERALIDRVDAGPVLDLGAGAGRAALHLQERGLDVTAVESSPGAADVCRRRGVRDVRVTDLNDPPDDRRWRAVLLLCGNLGLGGSWDGNRTLLRRLAELCDTGAVLIGDSVGHENPDVSLRLRYGDLVTPWWAQRNVGADEVPALIDGTGWRIETHLVEGAEHGVLLRRA